MDNVNYVNLKLDTVFKSFFTNRNNEAFLISFLSGILDIPEADITGVEVLNVEIPAEAVNDKMSRLDLNLKVAGRNVNVEMQVQSETGYKERAVYYMSKMYSDLKRGELYNQIPETIAIHILNHKLFECEDYQSTFRYYEENRHELLTDKSTIYFFELPKLSGKLDINNKKELWLNLISADTNERYQEIAELGDETMASAVRVIYDMREDTRIREAARMREKTINDWNNGMISAKMEGRAEGRAEGITVGRAEGVTVGRAEGKVERDKEISEKMKMLGLSSELIKSILS